ncbi:MAG: 30S ribosomal protein S1 [Firmicutes bacterium]|nr:30S ribosomal protein S1 [Bacillota bacterium]
MEENFSMEDFEKYLDTHFRKVYNGDLVTGTILSKDDSGLVVDVGASMDGILTVEDLLYEDESYDAYNVGDQITAKVKYVDSQNGQIMLSKKQADKETVWQTLSKMKDDGETIQVNVLRVVNGGLRIAWKDLQGFLPASQVSMQYTEDLSSYVGQTLEVRIIDVKEDKKDLVVSRKQLEQKEADEARQSVYTSLKQGTTLSGKVVRIEKFGAFVEIAPHVDGLVHVSDMSWSRVRRPDDVVKVGDIVQVTVLDVDADRGRISLSLRDVNADPWKHIPVREGDVTEGTVTRVIASGAFAEIAPGLEGFIHISRMTDKRIASVAESVQEGQRVPVKVLSVDPDQKRISLSIKDAKSDIQEKEDREVMNTYRESSESAVTNLGELLSEMQKNS